MSGIFLVLSIFVCAAVAQLHSISRPRYNPDRPSRDFPTPSGGSDNGPFQPVDPQRRRSFTPAPPPDNNVQLVIVGVASGNRNPDVFLRDDPNRDRWGEEGPSQLNTIGKREGLNLGRALRQRYGERVLTQQFFPTNYQAYSSTGESEEMTSQTVNAGLFPPSGGSVIDPSLNWQPIPVTTDDTFLGISRVSRCPAVREALDPIFRGQTPVVQDVLNREREVIDYIVRSTGIRPNNIEDLSEIAENLRQLRVRNYQFPQWAENPNVAGLTRESLYWRIQAFRNAVEVACSVYEPCRRLFSGVLLGQIQEIVERVRGSTTGTSPRQDTIGLVVYTGDVETILSVFRVLDLDYYNIPTAGGFVIEVQGSREQEQQTQWNTPSVRILYHEPEQGNNPGRGTPTTDNPHRFYIAEQTPQSRTNWNCQNCPVETFLNHIQPYIIQDYRVACRDNECNVVSPMADDSPNYVYPYPKTYPKGVDCTHVRDKYPEAACRELAQYNFCLRNNFVRNIVCRRTCHCTQFSSFGYIN